MATSEQTAIFPIATVVTARDTTARGTTTRGTTTRGTTIGSEPLAIESELSAQLETELAAEQGNLALNPDEIATLQSLVSRYDAVIAELDQLNDRIESLLQAEGIQACEKP
jgi:hypothetical protein